MVRQGQASFLADAAMLRRVPLVVLVRRLHESLDPFRSLDPKPLVFLGELLFFRNGIQVKPLVRRQISQSLGDFVRQLLFSDSISDSLRLHAAVTLARNST